MVTMGQPIEIVAESAVVEDGATDVGNEAFNDAPEEAGQRTAAEAWATAAEAKAKAAKAKERDAAMIEKRQAVDEARVPVDQAQAVLATVIEALQQGAAALQESVRNVADTGPCGRDSNNPLDTAH